MPLNARAGTTWEANASLRAEFGQNFGAYQTYAASLDAARRSV